jgi:hypothetical protein
VRNDDLITSDVGQDENNFRVAVCNDVHFDSDVLVDKVKTTSCTLRVFHMGKIYVCCVTDNWLRIFR